ncbi:MAG: hydrogenase maturation nickel metallochaperone HypA [Oscillatoriaceae cyanobacterium Prado104]|jgi:hydrogenase nickel incorporation protein HypA/HybF|nr:hydrogenase maturation nickel metallochaperone HypA [Oscillatoriaceae cyanobacterium Prado104]
MHELGITQNIVAIALEHSRGAKVRRVSLEIGKLSAIMPDAVRFCFDVCCQGTALEGASLEILEIPGIGQCRQCGSEIPLDLPFGICTSCGGTDLRLIQGEELKITELETDEICV